MILYKKKRWIGLFPILMLLLFSQPANAGRLANPSPDEFYNAAVWGNDLDAAVGRAQVNMKPILILFTAPDCIACNHVKEFILKQEGLQPTLKKFECVEIDLATQPELVTLARIQTIPSFLVLTSYGKITGQFNGTLSARELGHTLEQILTKDTIITDIDILVQRLETGKASISDWKQALLAMQESDARKKINTIIWNLSQNDLDTLVTCLTDDLLAIRLGALEILENHAETIFGLDPWINPNSDERQNALINRQKWQNANAGDLSDNKIIDKEKFESYLQDLIGSDNTEDSRNRSDNALRILASGGSSVSNQIVDYLETDPSLNEHAMRKIKEVQYALAIPKGTGNDPMTLAHNLIWGNQDVRIRTIFQISSLGKAVSPILLDLLAHPEPEIREAAVEGLFVSAGRYAVKPVKEHLTHEKNPDIIFLILKHLSDIKSMESQTILESYFTHKNEDIAIAAIEGAVKLSTRSLEEKLLPLIDDPRWRVKVAALQAIQEKGGIDSGFISKLRGKELLVSDHVADAIYKCLDDEDAFVRHTAAATVGKMKLSNAESPLKKAYKDHPDMRGMVISVFLDLDISIPDDYIRNLFGPHPDDLLFVLDHIKRVDTHTRHLIHRAARSKHPDIACTALRVMANTQNRTAEDNSILIKALQSNMTEKQLTVIQEFDTSSQEETNLINIMKEVLQPSSSRSSTSNASNEEILRVIAELMESPATSDIVKTDAMIVLCNYGYPGALKKAEKEWDILTPLNRTMVAKTFRKYGKQALPLFEKALNDDNAKVWEKAISQVNGKEGMVFIHALTQNLLTSSSRLRISAVWQAGIDDMVANDPKPFMSFATNVLNNASQHLPDRIIFALTVYTYNGITEDMKSIIQKLVDHENPFVRRMAYIALYHKDKHFYNHAEPVMADTSRYVRVLIPTLLYNAAYESRLDLYFSEEEVFSDYAGLRFTKEDPTYDDNTPKLNPDAIKVLNAMIENDPDNRIKFQCMITLLSNHIPYDLNTVVETGRAVADQDKIGKITNLFFNDHHYYLGKNFAVLLTLLETSGGRKYGRYAIKEFRERWGLTVPENDAFEITFKTVKQDNPITTKTSQDPIMANFIDPYKENSFDRTKNINIHMVFFTTSGCRSCAAAEGNLILLQKLSPGIRITRYDIHSTDGMIQNEILCRKFNVKSEHRGDVPAIFTSGGYLIGREITHSTLNELMKWSTPETDDEHMVTLNKSELTAASSIIKKRGLSSPWLTMASTGFSQGKSIYFLIPLIFLLYYLFHLPHDKIDILRLGGIYLATLTGTTLCIWFFLYAFFSNPTYLNQLGSIIIWIMIIVMVFFSIRFFFSALSHLRKKETPTKKTTKPPKYQYALKVTLLWGAVVSILGLPPLGDPNTATMIFLIKTHAALFEPIFKLLLYIIALVLPGTGIFAICGFASRNEKFQTFVNDHPAMVKMSISMLWFYLLRALINPLLQF